MDLKQLCREVQSMPDSAAKVDAIREGMRLADQLNDRVYSRRFRELLIDDAAYIGQFSDVVRDAFVALAWIISDMDKHNETVGVATVNDYQWVGRWIAHYPEISSDRIDSMLDDLRERLKAVGYRDRAYQEAMLTTSIIMDRREAADKAYKAYIKGKYDGIVRCDACIACRKIMYLRYIGDFEQIMREAEIYQKESCNKNPMTAYNHIIAAAVELGKLDEIAELQPKAYKMIAKDLGMVGYIGFHMIYFSQVDKAKGLELYKKHLKTSLMRNITPGEMFDFELGATTLLKNLGRKSFKAKLPTSFPLYNTDDKYDVAELAAHHYNKAKSIADSFDKRNGTDMFNRKLAQFVS